MKRVLGTGRILALVSLVFAAIPDSVMAGPINVDGVRDGNDACTHSFIANWTNERQAWQRIRRRHGRDDGVVGMGLWLLLPVHRGAARRKKHDLRIRRNRRRVGIVRRSQYTHRIRRQTPPRSPEWHRPQ